MTEEFIDDIIAAADDSTDSSADADANADANADSDENNTSTPEEAALKKDVDASDSGESDVAPTDSSEVEALATQLGWNKEHTGAERVDAATYILKSKDIQKTMKDHNKDLKNQLIRLQGSVEALKEHNERVYQADIKKLQSELRLLKKEKKDAIELADVDKVEELDKQIDNVKSTIDAPEKKSNSVNPIYDDWVKENGWYLTDNEMATYADTVAEQYAGAPPERVFAIVKQKVKEVFPDKFENEKTTIDTVDDKVDNKVEDKVEDKKVVGPKSPVEKGSRGTDGTGFTKSDLSADQLVIMNQFVKGGIMTEDQYVADIAKLQGA